MNRGPTRDPAVGRDDEAVLGDAGADRHRADVLEPTIGLRRLGSRIVVDVAAAVGRRDIGLCIEPLPALVLLGDRHDLSGDRGCATRIGSAEVARVGGAAWIAGVHRCAGVAGIARVACSARIARIRSGAWVAGATRTGRRARVAGVARIGGTGVGCGLQLPGIGSVHGTLDAVISSGGFGRRELDRLGRRARVAGVRSGAGIARVAGVGGCAGTAWVGRTRILERCGLKPRHHTVAHASHGLCSTGIARVAGIRDGAGIRGGAGVARVDRGAGVAWIGGNLLHGARVDRQPDHLADQDQVGIGDAVVVGQHPVEVGIAVGLLGHDSQAVARPNDIAAIAGTGRSTGITRIAGYLARDRHPRTARIGALRQAARRSTDGQHDPHPDHGQERPGQQSTLERGSSGHHAKPHLGLIRPERCRSLIRFVAIRREVTGGEGSFRTSRPLAPAGHKERWLGTGMERGEAKPKEARAGGPDAWSG